VKQKGKSDSILNSYRKHLEGPQEELLLGAQSPLSNRQLVVLISMNCPQAENIKTF